jgi:ubiquitin carboxyl-terminal hydrolase 4/11/15
VLPLAKANNIPDSVVSKCTSGQKAVTRSAYLLFYRRRSPVPLGPDHLREIVQAAETDATADSEAEDDDSNNRSRPRDANKSDSGNGQRLDGSYRNGSSSDGIGVAAGALAQRGHGFSDRGSLLKSGAGVANLSDDEDMPPMVDGSADEGFVDAEDSNDYTTFGGFQGPNDPMWSFEALGASSNRLHGSSDVASDAPNLGSEGPDDLSSRMLEDFGDDIHDGEDAPVDDVDDVHEIRVPSE